MAENDWAKKYLDDLNRKLKLSPKTEKPASKVERTAPIERSEDVRGRADVNQKDRGERRRRKSKGKNRDNRRPSGR
ncbi:MAG: hypothetical protein KDC45_04875, partial [Bacteroidetes bacterium]|nr:hypothetical protein [Bacteroidota bacterium]